MSDLAVVAICTQMSESIVGHELRESGWTDVASSDRFHLAVQRSNSSQNKGSDKERRMIFAQI